MVSPTPIYLVEDDDAVRAALGVLFELEGFTVRSYGSAQAFLHDEARLDADCLVTDVHMPIVNGLDLVRRLRADGETIPILVITGRAHLGLGAQAIQAGATRLIEKPFSPDEIVEAVRSILPGPAA